MGTWTAGLRALAVQPLWRRWTLASFLARLPVTMTLLALVLAGEEATGSLAIGAQLAGVATATSGLAALWRGRQLDRSELRGGLRRACAATALVLLAQAAALVLGAPVAVMFGLALAQGVAMAAISGGFRAMLAAVVPSADLPRGNVVEAVFAEVAFVAGPPLAGLLALAAGPVAVLLGMAAAIATSALITGRLPAYAPQPPASISSVWRVPGATPVLILAAATGFGLGLLEAAIPARVVALGFDSASAGPLLALTALGSAIGGLVAAARADYSGDVRRQAMWLFAALGILLAVPAAAGGPVALGVALLLVGLPIAPLNALGTLRLSSLVPQGRQAEGFALYIAAIMLGAGLGQAGTGLLLDAVDARAVLALAGAAPLVSAVALALSRRSPGSLLERPAPPEGLAARGVGG